MKNTLMFTILLTLTIAGCSSVNVSTDYDPGLDFSGLKTYAWHPQKNAVKQGDARMVNEIMHKRILSTIDKQLQFQQYTPQQSSPDFYVNYSVTTEDKVDVRTYDTYGGYGPGWGWGPGYGHHGAGGYGYTETVATEYQEGSLIIDIVDPKNNFLVWRGIGSKRLPSKADSEKLDELVYDVVVSILENFPPNKKD